MQPSYTSEKVIRETIRDKNKLAQLKSLMFKLKERAGDDQNRVGIPLQ